MPVPKHRVRCMNETRGGTWSDARRCDVVRRLVSCTQVSGGPKYGGGMLVFDSRNDGFTVFRHQLITILGAYECLIGRIGNPGFLDQKGDRAYTTGKERIARTHTGYKMVQRRRRDCCITPLVRSYSLDKHLFFVGYDRRSAPWFYSETVIKDVSLSRCTTGTRSFFSYTRYWHKHEQASCNAIREAMDLCEKPAEATLQIPLVKAISGS